MPTPGMEIVLRNPPINLEYPLKAVDYVGHSPEERLRLKAEILRSTLFLEWLTIGEIHALAPPDSELSNYMLNAHLDNVRLGKTTLAQMDIVPVPGTLSPEFSSFPNWHLLLPELQAKILDWLTSPEDKLNVLEAYPKAAGVMGKKWKSAFALRFEVNFSRQFGEPGCFSWSNWRNMQMFRITSPEIRSVINEQFEEYLKAGEEEEEYYDPTLRCLLRSNSAQRWRNTDPITSQVFVDIGDERVDEGEVDPFDMLTEKDYENGLRRLEEWIGPRTWHCCFNYTGESISPVKFLQRMSHCLEKMPSLRKMVVDADMYFENNWNTTLREVENLSFPDLPFMHSLVLRIQNSDPQLTLIRTKLMQRYAAQLNRLEFTFYHDGGGDFFPVDFQHQPEFPAFPHLTIWKCTCSNSKDQGWGWDLHCDLLQKLVGSPLKIAHFTVNVSAGEKGFSDLLNVLGKGFGGSLEELDIIAKVPAGQQIQASWEGQSGDKWKENLVNVAFPKLKHLKINVDPCPEGWEFLLLFPALEKLTFSFSRFDQVENRQADREDSIVELTSNLELMRQANIWKLFPNLKEIVKKEEVFEFELHEPRSETITRQEILTAAAAD